MTYTGYPTDYFDKNVIITAAMTGGLHDKSSNPNLPEQPEEIITDVKQCADAGASIVHIHARDEDGNPTKELETFQEIRDGIDEACDDIIVNFTGGGVDFTMEERLEPILETNPRPDMASIDMGPMNFGQDFSTVHTRAEHETFARAMQNHGVKPEIELFHPGQLTELNNLIEKDLLKKPFYCNLIFGMQTGTIPHPRNLVNFVDNLPDESTWTCMAIGRHQLPLTTVALIMGGHVRVGMEDNVYYRANQPAESNAQLVKRTARLANELGRPIATPDDAREMLDL